MSGPNTAICDTYLEGSGEHTRRIMALDPAHGRVVDGTLNWHDGAANPSAVPGLVAFVHQDGACVEWGTRDGNRTRQ